MTRKPRAKPKTPDQIQADKLAQRAADLAAVGMQLTAATLRNHEAVEITRAGQQKVDGKTVQTDMARRLDAFDALRPSMEGEKFVGAYDAARRFERDVMTSLGLHDSGRPEKVDSSPAAGDRTDAIIAASQRVARARSHLPDRDGWLLVELIVPSKQGEDWRSVVARITGEENQNAQGATVRAACVNLRDHYQRQDVASRKAA